MSGLLLILILIIWLFIVKALSRFCIARMVDGRAKRLGHGLLFVLLLLAPVADDIAGGVQFRSLCSKKLEITYAADKISGKTILWAGLIKREIENSIIPIEERLTSWADLISGEVLLEYKEYVATGGWLSRLVSFNGVSRPYTFNGVCSVKDELMALQGTLRFERKYK